MQKSKVLIREYVQAGFTKLHLDCSMRLGDDPADALDVETVAQRAAQLAQAAEEAGRKNLRYIIGTEVPVPGGATEHEDGVHVTRVEDARQTIEVTHAAFARAGLNEAWKRVIGVVVQPGVEFGDDFVLSYQPAAAHELSKYIETLPLIYEAHSTDYQTREALQNLVRDHFAILKVGPALTFAFREAIFAGTMIENELVAPAVRSNIIQVLDDVMVKYPEHWQKYYRGTGDEQAYKRKYSLSDRARYYWVQPQVQQALAQLVRNFKARQIPLALMSQFAPMELQALRINGAPYSLEGIVSARISRTLRDYARG